MYREGQGIPQDYAVALRSYHKAAEAGIAEAQRGLGLMYWLGQGATQDTAEAVRWNRKAAEQGEETAQGAMGSAYFVGDGVPQDYVMAHMWWNLAAAQAGDNRKTYATFRDELTKKMSHEQLAEAQRLAREWRPSKRK